MARPPSKQPTDGELEILKILWETGPAGLGQIHAVLQSAGAWRSPRSRPCSR